MGQCNGKRVVFLAQGIKKIIEKAVDFVIQHQHAIKKIFPKEGPKVNHSNRAEGKVLKHTQGWLSAISNFLEQSLSGMTQIWPCPDQGFVS